MSNTGELVKMLHDLVDYFTPAWGPDGPGSSRQPVIFAF